MNSTTAAPKKTKRLITIIVAIVVLLAVVIAAQLIRLQENNAAPKNADSTPSVMGGGSADADSNTAAPPALEAVTIGDPNAPLVIREWVDMACPYCALFTNQVFPELVAEYVDSGKARIEVTVVSYFGEGSDRGAVAAYAAADQGKFKEFITTAYAATPPKQHPELKTSDLITFAKSAGVADLEKFEAALNDPQSYKRVQEITADASRMGVTGVPFFVVQDKAFSGAQPLPVFKQILDEAASKQ